MTYILVLSWLQDTTALRIIRELKQRGADVVFMDTGSFPQHISLDVTFAAGRWEGTFSYEGKKHELSAMRSVLVRRPSHYQVSRDAPEPIQAFLENEALKGFGGVLRSLTHVFWMNSLDASRSANFKPVQMRVAAEAGMLVPHSLITNTPDAVRRFYEECHGRMIYKTLHGGGIAGGGDVAHTVLTSVVTQDHLQHLEQVRLTAHQFQILVEKYIEVRVTVSGTTCIAVAIYSQKSENTRVDWRASYEDLEYSLYTLPPFVERQCIQITHQLGLNYGAIDLIVTPEGEHIFLEINAGGQYEWLESETKLPFSAIIAETLVKGKTEVI